MRRNILAFAFIISGTLIPLSTKANSADARSLNGATMIKAICAAMQLSFFQCRITAVNMGLSENALAGRVDGRSVIVFDNNLPRRIGIDHATVILAHEIGHHFCGHLSRPPQAAFELQADAFAGATMRRLGRSLPATLSAASLFEKSPTKNHPGRPERERALAVGWSDPEAAKTCGRSPLLARLAQLSVE